MIGSSKENDDREDDDDDQNIITNITCHWNYQYGWKRWNKQEDPASLSGWNSLWCRIRIGGQSGQSPASLLSSQLSSLETNHHHNHYHKYFYLLCISLSGHINHCPIHDKKFNHILRPLNIKHYRRTSFDPWTSNIERISLRTCCVLKKQTL